MTRSIEWDVIVVGGANMDYLIRSDRLPQPGETTAGNEFHEAPGGKGANQAVAAARLGARVAFVARIGSDRSGDQIVKSLEVERVKMQYVIRDVTVPSGVALIVVDREGEKQIATAPGANGWLTVSDIESAAEGIRASRVLLAQLEVPLVAVTRAVTLAHQNDVRVVLDPAPATSLDDDLLRKVDVIRANALEAAAITGIRVENRSSARRCGRELIRRGVRSAIVSMGLDGTLVIWGNEDHQEDWLPLVPIKSVDSTGAGDAFSAALAVMLAEGRSLSEAASFANTAAAINTTVVGAQAGLPRREAVNALMANQLDGLAPGE